MRRLTETSAQAEAENARASVIARGGLLSVAVALYGEGSPQAHAAGADLDAALTRWTRADARATVAA